LSRWRLEDTDEESAGAVSTADMKSSQAVLCCIELLAGACVQVNISIRCRHDTSVAEQLGAIMLSAAAMSISGTPAGLPPQGQQQEQQEQQEQEQRQQEQQQQQQQQQQAAAGEPVQHAGTALEVAAAPTAAGACVVWNLCTHSVKGLKASSS
jgi:hypothetical protein